MKILVADDDSVARLTLESLLLPCGHDVITAADGDEAWTVMQGADAPALAILDWLMPGRDGAEICRLIHGRASERPPYLILLTCRADRTSAVAGLAAEANDFLRKPFETDELRARVEVGIRVVELQHRLADRVREVEAALAHVKRLQGILPICSYCKKIRNDKNSWQQVEAYVSQHSEAQFSHGVCPDCLEREVQEMRAEGYDVGARA